MERKALAILALGCLLGMGQPAHAKGNEIRISLFGQPCSLQGPVDERTLRVIHSLSPDQTYPSQDNSANALNSSLTRKAIDKLKAMTGTPAGLDRYRERLLKRLNAQLALLDAFDSLKKNNKLEPVIAAAKPNLSAARLKDFEAAIRKAEAAKTLGKTETLEALLDTYNEGIEPDPEEEFHRAIQRMKVQYACSFEESGQPGGARNAAE